MNAQDIYILSPQISIVSVAILTILLDLIVSKKRLVMGLALVGLTVPLVLAIFLWLNLNESPLEITISNISVLHGSFNLDKFGLFFNLLVIGCAAVAIMGSDDYVRRSGIPAGEYFGLMLLAASGMMLLASAGNLITIYIALELTALPLVALSALSLNSKSTEAGAKFFIISALSSAIMLYGMALIYGLSGSITLEGIAAGLVSNTSGVQSGSLGLVVALTLTIVGFGFKLSAVPFHMWVPDVYEGAPTPVVAFLSVASKAVAFALVLRFFYIGLYDVPINWSVLFAVIAAISMTIGNLLAIPQSNIKRLFGYSTIAHAGYIMVGIAAVSDGDGLSAGPSSLLFYLVAYAAANLTALLAINQISEGVGSDRIEDYSGVAYKSPMLAIVLTLSLMALIGVPPTGIFIAKIYVFTAAVNNGLMWLAIVGVVNSVISAYYYLRVVRVMFRGSNTQYVEKIISGMPVKVAILTSAAVTIYLGIGPSKLLGAAENAAKILGIPVY